MAFSPTQVTFEICVKTNSIPMVLERSLTVHVDTCFLLGFEFFTSRYQQIGENQDHTGGKEYFKELFALFYPENYGGDCQDQ